MRERPILFNAEMVRAILAGRKTVTRRPVKFATGAFWDHGAWTPSITGPRQIVWHTEMPSGKVASHTMPMACPYGAPGDRLYVRETWAPADCFYQSHEVDPPRMVAYRADLSALDHDRDPPRAPPAYDIAQWNFDSLKWHPSIFMRRFMSRILLDVVSVRVERVQSISEGDAKAEGMTGGGCLACGVSKCFCDDPRPSLRESFIWTWEQAYGTWHANPWVWRVEFRRTVAA